MRATGREADFRIKIANLHLRDLALRANASEPVRAETGSSDDLFFIMILQGVCRTEIEKRKYEVAPNRRALLLTERSIRYGESGIRSVFVARLDASRLCSTARSMAGIVAPSTAFRLNQSAARNIDLKFGRLDHAASMRALPGLIDLHFDRSDALSALGVAQSRLTVIFVTLRSFA